MTRLNGSRTVRTVAFTVITATVLGALGCGTRSAEKGERLTASSTLAPGATPPAAVTPVPAVKDSCPILVNTELEPAKPSASARQATLRTGEAGLTLKRFVVTSGVDAREPLVVEGDLSADGSPIFAFAELANTSDRDQEVRVTFARKGSDERVGNVSLVIPANTPRYRTWAKTRYVRDPGTWVAVIVNEHGTELGRSTFDAIGTPS